MTGLFLAFLGVCGLMALYNPLYGIAYLLADYTMAISDLAPGVQSYHPNIILALVVSLSVFVRRVDLRKGGFIFLIGLFVAEAGISGLLSGFGPEGGYYMACYLKCFIFSTLLLNFIKSKNEVLFLLKCYIVFCLCNGVYAFYEQLSGTAEQITGTARSIGLAGQPNLLSFICMLGFPFAYYLFLYGERKFLKRAYIVAIGCILMGVLCSVSRSGLLATGFAGTCIFLRNIKKISTIIIFAVVVLMFMNFALEMFQGRGAIVEEKLSGRTEIESGGRLSLFKLALELWVQNPVFGVGPNRYAEACRQDLGKRIYHMPHNVFLLVLSEYGLLGFIVFISIIRLAFKDISRLMRHHDFFYQELAFYLRIMLFALLIISMFGAQQRNPVFWFFLSLPCVLQKISADSDAKPLRGEECS